MNLRERARAEVETQALIEAQTVAAGLDRSVLGRPRQRLAELALRYAREIEGRVLLMDPAGIVHTDGNVLPEPAASAVGQENDTDQRPENQVALDPSAPRPVAQIRFSDELGSDIVVAAAPILDDQQLVGAVRVTSDVHDVTDSVRAVTIGLVVVSGAGLVAELLIAFGVAGRSRGH